MILVGCRSGVVFINDNMNSNSVFHLEESASHPLPLIEGVPQFSNNP